MIVKFHESRDLGEHGTVAAGETRSDLPEEYAKLQVEYGNAEEIKAEVDLNPKLKTQNPKPKTEGVDNGRRTVLSVLQ